MTADNQLREAFMKMVLEDRYHAVEDLFLDALDIPPDQKSRARLQETLRVEQIQRELFDLCVAVLGLDEIKRLVDLDKIERLKRAH
jgi:hypothetical protein